MDKSYALHVTSHFERDLKRLKKMDRKVGQEIEALGHILQEDPHNVNRSYNIRKLAGVVKGEGQWRIRWGDYRVRYDIEEDDVILHSVRHRKEIYR